MVPQVSSSPTATTVLLCVVAGVVAARLHGFDRGPQRPTSPLTVLTRGGSRSLLASLALAAGLDPPLGGFAAGYVLVLAVLGPIAVSSSARLAWGLPQRWFPQPVREPEPVSV